MTKTTAPPTVGYRLVESLQATGEVISTSATMLTRQTAVDTFDDIVRTLSERYVPGGPCRIVVRAVAR